MKKNTESDNPIDLSLKTFVKNFIKEVFYFDRRINKTLAALFTKPGQLTLACFRNTDEKYIQPLKLYFMINFMFFLLIPVLNTPDFRVFSFSMESMTAHNPYYQNIIQRQIQSLDVQDKIYAERFNAHLKYNQPAFVFLLIPLFALILGMVNFKKKRYFVEHLIFSTHFLSFFLLVLLIMILLFKLLAFGLRLFSIANGVAAIIIFSVFILCLISYLFAGTRVFYKDGIFSAMLKSILLFAGFILTMGGYVQFLFFYSILALNWGY